HPGEEPGRRPGPGRRLRLVLPGDVPRKTRRQGQGPGLFRPGGKVDRGAEGLAGALRRGVEGLPRRSGRGTPRPLMPAAVWAAAGGWGALWKQTNYPAPAQGLSTHAFFSPRLLFTSGKPIPTDQNAGNEAALSNLAPAATAAATHLLNDDVEGGAA